MSVDVEEGVRGVLWAAFGGKGEGKGEVRSGVYYTPVGKEGDGSWWARDEGLGERLWGWMEGELTRWGVALP